MIRFLPLLALALAACAADERAPQRPDGPTIVSLNPCSDAILAEVASPEQLLAISHYSKDPAASSMTPEAAARFPATGGTVEEVIALQPDVVVASTFLAPATRSALEDFGVRVVTVGGIASVDESLAQVRQLAALAGNPAAGERLAGEIAGALEEAQWDGSPVEAALWQPGGIVPGEASLVSDLLRRTGFASYAASRGLGQAEYLALEQVVADPPPVLFVAGGEAGQRHPVLGRIDGMHQHAFDTRLLYCGGPTIIRALRFLSDVRREVS